MQGPLHIDLYGWAIWYPTGSLHSMLTADTPATRTDGVNAVATRRGWTRELAVERLQNGWHIDSLDAQAYHLLHDHKHLLRDEFLTGWLADRAREACGQPHPQGWAAWTPTGALMAAGGHVRGLSGWHCLGIGEAADGCFLDEVTEAELQQLGRTTSSSVGLWGAPDSRDRFLAWRSNTRQRNGAQDGEQAPRAPQPPDTGDQPSRLAYALSQAIFEHADGDYGGTPHVVLGQYLETCLDAYSSALADQARRR